MTPQRTEVVGQVVDLVTARRRPGRVLRVGVDGVDGAGKTVLGDELAAALRRQGIDVIRASVDGFHRPAEVRYQQGRRSPRGFYEDSYDYDALRRELLDPLGENGSGRYRIAAFDVLREAPVAVPQLVAGADAVLVLDGIFLHRPELSGAFDLTVFVRVPFEVSVPRCAGRDGGSPDPASETVRRYVEGQRHYLALCRPELAADVVLDNTDLAAPSIVRPVGTFRTR